MEPDDFFYKDDEADISEPLVGCAPTSTYETKMRLPGDDEFSKDMDMVELLFRFCGIEEPPAKHSKWPPSICMVPKELRRGDSNGCYDPVAVQIGLCISRRLEKLHPRFKESPGREFINTKDLRQVLPKELQDMERYKSSCVLQLMSRRPDKKPGQLVYSCYDGMNRRLRETIRCHSNAEGRFMDLLALLRTLVIDGCFILHRLVKYAHLAERKTKKQQGGQQGGGSEEDDDWTLTQACGRCFAFVWQLMTTRETTLVKQGQGVQASCSKLYNDYYGDHDCTQTGGRCFVWQLVTRDLLLLENQIPFFVLRELFQVLKKDGESDEILVKGGLMLFRALCPQMLLHRPDSSVFVSDIAKKLDADADADGVHHLLHLFYLLVGWRELIKHPAPAGRPASGNNNDDDVVEELDVLPSELPQWIPGAKELLEAGIRLRKRKGAVSFLEIRFDARRGVLEIPPLQLYDYSEALFRNMIAFEQTYPRTKFDVSTYSVFMNCLVSTAEDARILHLRGILVNMMNGGDQDGGRHFFDRICWQVHFPSDNYLVDTMTGVNEYMQSRRHRWRAALVRDYFSNPWVAISVGAAVFLLFLTVLQTFFTVYPYFKPSK